MAASALHFRRGACASPSLSMLLYAGTVVAAVHAGAASSRGRSGSPGSPLALPRGLVAEYTVAVHLLGFLAVGLLSGSLAERVRTADAQLADASTAIANLQAYSEHIIDSLTMGLVTTDLERPHPDVQPGGRDHHRPRATTPRRAGRPPTCCGLPPEFAAALDAGIGRTPGSRRADYRYRRPDGTRDRPRPQRHARSRRRRARRASSSRSRTSPRSGGSSATPACSSAWRPSARWRRGSPTRSGTRWRRSPARCRSCARSSRSTASSRS